jgi:uncharacterized protein with FMN-binding domain
MSTSSHSSFPPEQGAETAPDPLAAHRSSLSDRAHIGHLPHKRHPARGARAVALAASVVATGGVGLGMAYGEGAFDSDSEPPGDVATAAPPVSTAIADVPVNSVRPAISDTTPTSDEIVAQESSPSADRPTSTIAEPDVVTIDDATTGEYADGVYLGKAYWIQWGYVQIEATISGGQIIDTEAVRKPRDRRSTEINDHAEPILEAQAIETQFSDVDIVSGATYTSRAYARSLQFALDLAALDQTATTDSASDEAST